MGCGVNGKTVKDGPPPPVIVEEPQIVEKPKEKSHWDKVDPEHVLCLMRAQIAEDVQRIRNQMPNDSYEQMESQINKLFGESAGKKEFLRITKKTFDIVPLGFSPVLAYEGVLNACLRNAAVPKLEL